MPEPVDRFHNRERDSPEALRETIEGVAASVRALEGRLDGTDLAVDGARASTRRLAAEVARLGEHLARRIDAAGSAGEPVAPAPPRRRDNVVAWSLGLAAVLAAVLALAVALPK